MYYYVKSYDRRIFFSAKALMESSQGEAVDIEYMEDIWWM